MTTETDLHIDARLLVNVVGDLDKDVTAYSYDEDLSDTLEADLIAWAMLEEANRQLAVVRGDLAKRLAEAMPEKRLTVMGAGTFERHVKKDRTKWDKEALLSAVLDSRIVDPTTGEVLDPRPLDKVLAVWNLGAPRVTALRERGIDADQFAEVERGGYTIQFVANAPITEAAA